MLLKTRFYLPPMREGTVIREPLIHRLNQTSGGEVILLSSPPGYGKTTLLTQWLHKHPHIFSWLTLDANQSDPLVFWEHVIHGLQAAQPDVGGGAREHLLQGDLQNAVVSLLNDFDGLSAFVRGSVPMTLVLDDFHKVSHGDTIALLNVFFDHLPASLRVAVTSRTEPELNLSRRKMNGQLTVISASELAFDFSDSCAFFEYADEISVAVNQVEHLRLKLEGWPAGYQLVALSLQQQSEENVSGELLLESLLGNQSLHRDIADYLVDEVFARQSQDLQQFLVATAYPSRFCAALANELLGRSDGLSVLKQIDQLNLFLVPLDNHRTWYRYHDLFRQFLLQRFDELPDDHAHKIKQRAVCWLESGGYTDIGTADGMASLTMNNGASENVSDVPVVSTEPLTRRERQVMAYLKEGYANKEIADQLHISLNTLKVHIRNLYGKIGVENRSQALAKMTK